jgi:CRISPR-associated endonuclease/helicase Cas3
MKPFPDFATFFHSIWGYDPFPWQERMAEQTAAGLWPGWITLPTGTGKTTVLDIAIYNLARQAAHPSDPRTAPVRIIFAVNRRIVVDEAYERAKTIANRLKTALTTTVDPIHPVALALHNLSGIENGAPLETYPLRGATFTDHSWARTPTQPLVISTTLDQLGSRLLFRGYGVSANARPIHAALLANDALLILDEAHTAKAFSQTLQSVAVLRKQATQEIKLPFAAVQLTATPPPEVREPFSLDETDRNNSIIAARLSASKPTELVPVVEGAKGKGRHKKLAEVMGTKAISLLSFEHRRVLIVVNRVATAEALADRLTASKVKKEHDADVLLLTGRLRPLDRDVLIKSLNETYQLKSNIPTADVPKLILIATQCIEVGADFDFDALISELAPLDSLRQRFGRLNRQGRDIPASAAIFTPEEANDASKPDPLYGDCLPAVRAWLASIQGANGTIDFGLDAMRESILNTPGFDRLLAQSADAPILLAPHLDLLCQTSPEPHVSPDPSLYIHGPGRSFPEVSVVLRADIADQTKAALILGTVTPIGTEAATVPLLHARNWLENPAATNDNSGDAPEQSTAGWSKGELEVLGAFRFSSGEASPIENSNDLRPGDILVVPTQTKREWLEALLPIPESKKDDPCQLDQYERAYLLSRDRLSIRFHRQVRNALRQHLTDNEARVRFEEITTPLFAHDEEEQRWVFRERDWTKAIPLLAEILAKHLPDNHPLKSTWTHAAARPGNDWKAIPYPAKSSDGVLITNRSRVGATPWPLDPADLGRQGNASNTTVLLTAHSETVASRAESNAKGLSEQLCQTLQDAGAWHDLGKLDPRFQAMLHGCSLQAAVAKPALAKSEPRSQAMTRGLLKLTELPEGFRHELLSALIVAESKTFGAHPEPDLLLHLIASHHGRCRAMAPVIHDANPEPFDASLDAETIRFAGKDCPLAHLSDGVARRFWQLTRRFGWWGLPYLETLLRLADQYESANPKKP